VFYEIFGERVRGNELRTLLGMLSSYLRRHGYENVAAEVDHFVDEHRRDLIAADIRRLRDVARKLMGVLEGVVEAVKLG